MKIAKLSAVAVPALTFILLSSARADTTELILNDYQYSVTSSDPTPTIVTSTFTSPQYSLQPEALFFGGFSVWAYNGPYMVGSATFSAPNGVPLQPGTYTDATRFPFNPPGTPGFDYTIFSYGPNTTFGEFTVLEAVYDSSGVMQHFGATFEDMSPEDGRIFATGTLYYNFDLPIATPEPSTITLIVLSLISFLCFSRLKKAANRAT